MGSDYTPPLALTVLSGIFLLLGAVCALIVTGDIVWRKGWRSMMWIMIPVYIINAAYMLPVTLWVYFKYGRAAVPLPKTAVEEEPKEQSHSRSASDEPQSQPAANTDRGSSAASPVPAEQHNSMNAAPDAAANQNPDNAEKASPSDEEAHCHHHQTSSRPMYATVLVGVSHCGAGCVLGDLVGEWLVYGTHATISHETIWVELLVDYAFALLFGIGFQYFSIAPMSGEYGPKSVWRAAKADVLSLTSFEVGAFGWMVIYQVGIWDYRLGMTTWTYWWMMQIGMAFGFATAMPVNWWLISKGIKEPCA